MCGVKGSAVVVADCCCCGGLLLLWQALGSDEQRCTMVKTEVVNLRSELEALEAENNGMSDGAELQVLWWWRRRWW